MLAPGDYHAVLGVPPNASEEDIKRAYRNLAIIWHPDKNSTATKEATRMFQLLNEAFQALSPTKACQDAGMGSPDEGVPERSPDSGGSRVEVRTVPTSFRIGPTRHHYEYHILDTNFYKCGRGSDWAQAGEVLFLVQDKEYWVALDASCGATTAAETLAIGHPVFRSRDLILNPGWHKWETNYSSRGGQNWRPTGLCCETTVQGFTW